MVVTTIWVSEVPYQERPNRFRAWFHTTPYGLRIGPLSNFGIPAEVIDAARALDGNVAGLPDGMVEDPPYCMDPVDLKSSVDKSE